jgi:hypothetical protein
VKAWTASGRAAAESSVTTDCPIVVRAWQGGSASPGYNWMRGVFGLAALTPAIARVRGMEFR